MFKFNTQILNFKQLKSKAGKEFEIYSCLDRNKNFSRVIDVADFDQRLKGVSLGTKVEFEVSVKVFTSEKTGRAFINLVILSDPVVLVDQEVA
jgi:hypothetical protein